MSFGIIFAIDLFIRSLQTFLAMQSITEQQYPVFRNNCLANAEGFLDAARRLIGQQQNHVVYHLCALALEEIGKIFLGWIHLRDQDNRVATAGQFDMEDHIRKLFWAIWGPSFLEECFDPKEWEENRGLATNIHNTRLSSLYTGINDLFPSAHKISDDQAANLYRLATDWLAIARDEEAAEEEEGVNITDPSYGEFLSLLRAPAQRDFIFGSIATAKLKELGTWRLWIAWLVQHFADEAALLNNLLQQELARQPLPDQPTFTPKWRITFTLYTTTHTIRNALNNVSIEQSYVRVRAGENKSKVTVELYIDQLVPITQLYHQGRYVSQLFLVALNAASTGLFWWEVHPDPDQYYDKIEDLESHTFLSARLTGGASWQWPLRRPPLQKEHLERAHFILLYFFAMLSKGSFEPVHHYLNGLAMLAKTDLHLPLGIDAFLQFYTAFRKALGAHEVIPPGQDIKIYGYAPLNRIILDQASFEALMDKAAALMARGRAPDPSISLTEVLHMKNCMDWYFFTPAARHFEQDPTLLVTILEDDNANP